MFTGAQLELAPAELNDDPDISGDETWEGSATLALPIVMPRYDDDGDTMVDDQGETVAELVAWARYEASWSPRLGSSLDLL
ncbi:MAG: hypothetical protein AAFY60_09445, partial [Myxococcota bacterium]